MDRYFPKDTILNHMKSALAAGSAVVIITIRGFNMIIIVTITNNDNTVVFENNDRC